MFNLNFFIGIYKKDENSFSIEDQLLENINLDLFNNEKEKTIGDHIIHFLSQQDKPPLNVKNKINISRICKETDLVYTGYDNFLVEVDDNSILFYFLNDTEHLNLFFYLFERFFYYHQLGIVLPNTKLYLQYLFRTSDLFIAYHIYIYFLFYFGKHTIIKDINNLNIEYLSQYSINEIVLDMISCESFNYKNNIENILKIIKDKNEIVNRVDSDNIFLWFINRVNEEKNEKIINKVIELLYEMDLKINDKTFSFILNSSHIHYNIKRLVELKEIGF